MDLQSMKVDQLKSLAKDKGIKGAYKMKKAELVAALELTNNEGVVAMNAVVNNSVEVKEVLVNGGEVKMERRSVKELIAEGNVKELTSLLTRRNRASFKMMKQSSKNMDVVAGYQVVCIAEEVQASNGEKSVRLKVTPEVAVGLGSRINRATCMKYAKIADKSMVLTTMVGTETISVNLDNSLFKDTKTHQALRKRLFNMLKGKSYSKHGRMVKESLNLIINKESGLARVSFTKAVELKDSEVMKSYQFFGVSPSGLRSKSFLAGAVTCKVSTTEVACDRRNEILDESIDGALTESFVDENGSFKEYSKSAQFKNATRLTLGAPGSQEMLAVNNYIVFDNIAAGVKAVFEGTIVDAENTCDGMTLMSAEHGAADFNNKGVPVTTNDVVGICEQIRGAGLKASAVYELREDLVTLARHLLSSESEAVVSYVVANGVRYNNWTELVASGVSNVQAFFANLQMIADTNAMKITKHNATFRPVKLKMAYQSSMNLSLVTTISLLAANEDKATEVIRTKVVSGLTKKFRQLGIKFEYVDGNINGIELDSEGLKALNNEGQFMTYLLKCDPETIMRLFPGVVRSELSNAIKGIANTLANAEIELENSNYTVVQSDKGVLFGAQILAENEIVCEGLTAGTEVMITRHPISSLHALTVLKVVSIEEIVERILSKDISIDKKQFLLNFFGRAQQWCIIPASHRLMEKHDGMDFDIDAVQIIADKDVVAIAKEYIVDRGSVIIDDEDRYCMTPEEEVIANVQKNGGVFALPSKISSNNSRGNGNTSARVGIKGTKKTRVYSLGYDSVCETTEEYYSSTLASVGVIANTFYNNALMLCVLRSNTIEQSVKDAIVKAFKKYYGCYGADQYVSTIDRTSKVFKVKKSDCTSAIFRFANSNGDMHSLIAFLEDACDYNRYLAETSIDAAKNNYYVINMFDHNKVVRALGSKPNCKVELINADDTYAEIAADMEYSENNYFGIDLLEFDTKGLSLEEWTECNGEQFNAVTGMMEQVPLAVEDTLFFVKDEARVIANQLIVATTKEIESDVLSQEACELRELAITEANRIVDGKNVSASIDAIKKSYTSLTLGLKEDKTSDEIEGISKAEYMKTVAINGIKNYVKHAFADFSTVEIGAIVCADLISKVSDVACGTINAALYKVCEAEIIEFLADFGVENIGFIGEAVSYAELNNKKIKLESIVGMNVSVADGTAELEDGTTIVMKDRRAEIFGTIIDNNGHYYVKATKEIDAADSNAGLYINVKNEFNKHCVRFEEFDAVSYEFKTVATFNGKKLFYVIVGTNAEGVQAPVACLSGRADIAKLFTEKKMNLDNISIMRSVNNAEVEHSVLYIPGEDYVAALNTEVVAEDAGFDFGDIAMPSFDQAPVVAPASEEAAFDFSEAFENLGEFNLPMDIA